jgi:GTP cyclohydrolase II
MTERTDFDESRPVPRDAARQRRVDRAVGELRRGTPVVLCGAGRAVVVSAAETAAFGGLTRLRELTPAPVELVLTGRRAGGLGLDIPAETVALSGRALTQTDLLGLADPAAPMPALDMTDLSARPGGSLAQSALQATKLAHLLPAALQAALETQDAAAWARQHDLLMVEAGDIAAYQDMVAGSLAAVAEARVPIAGAENTRLRAFRPSDGGIEHLAIVIGEPRAEDPVLVRLHSECFTGDLLGSLRCDCGDQLRGAIDTMAEAGAGIILYLAQEGRGIGLINKLRAYHLQDAGADTLDANEALGFEPDERIYAPAAAMLKAMGFTTVKLLTNNPDKVAALTRWGVTVESRVPHRFPSNHHSADYISTKVKRFGHLY